MASKYNKNCILTGAVDSLCLLCQIYLKANDMDRHVESSQHHSNLKSINYADNFKKDLIWKVKQGYYCEICNVIIQTTAKVQIHLNDSIHIKNKPKHLLKEFNKGVIVFDDIFIEMYAWHGLSDGSCFICNIDYDDEDTHVSEPRHAVNLIQSSVELKDQSVYRKMDDNLINCLICNTLISVESKESHIKSPEHIKLYLKCQENKKKIFKGNGLNDPICIKVDTPKNITETKEMAQAEKHPDSDKSATRENIDNNCSNSNESKNNASITTCEKENQIVTASEALQQAIQFAKKNHMKYKRNSTYCTVCNIRISSSLKMMKEHVSETSHKEKADKLKQTNLNDKTPGTCNKKSMLDFIDSETTVTNIFRNDKIINDYICIEDMSFNMISKSSGKLRCHACDDSFHPLQIEHHKRTYKHSNAMLVTPVLTDFKDEFIREVRSGIFHCGICNFVESSLVGLQNHLKSVNHSARKTSLRGFLMRYMPEIMESRGQDQFLRFMRMLQNN